MNASDARSLREFYERQLFENILPFWLQRAPDRERGGFFTCFNNRGDALLHRHKFTWSQGRFVWVLSRLYREFRGRRPAPECEGWLDLARTGAEFLMRHALLPNGNCAFILSEKGEPILLDAEGKARTAGPGECYDTSVYADCFAIYGAAEYADVSGDRAAWEFASNLYERVYRRIMAPPYPSDPYPIPAGYEAHGRPMILTETAHELSRIGARFGDPRAATFLDHARSGMAEILDRFRDPETGLIREFLSSDPAQHESMLCNYVNPGHMLESMWFLIHLARRLDDRERIAQAIEVIRAAAAAGWDAEYGGYVQFMHRRGGPPRGHVPPELENAAMTQKLRENWDNKLWWPHSEALYALLLAHALSGDAEFLALYRRVHEYAFRVFPHPDPGIGEWIQIRTRAGAPIDKVVALPVKDPFHIARAFMLCSALLKEG